MVVVEMSVEGEDVIQYMVVRRRSVDGEDDVKHTGTTHDDGEYGCRW